MNKEKLISELAQLVEQATIQNVYEIQRNKSLYRALAKSYLWWRKAKEIKGFLEEQYTLNGIRGQSSGEEKFIRLLKLIWRIDWVNEASANLQTWSNALRKIHRAYESNKQAYRANAEEQLIAFIISSGGIGGLIGLNEYFEKVNSEEKNKNNVAKKKREIEDEDKMRKKHIELGEQFFENEAKSRLTIEANIPIGVTDKNYAIALIRKSRNNKFELLSTINDSKLIEDAIVETYKRTDSAAPEILQLLKEIIITQSIPRQMESVRDNLNEISKYKNDFGKKLNQYKRVLFRKEQQDIILSENRTDCSVVTIVKPKYFPLVTNEDVFLRVVDRRYFEKAIIQNEHLSLYKTEDDKNISVIRNDDYESSHRVVLTNTVTKKKRTIYFNKLSVLPSNTKKQAYISTQPNFTWVANVDKLWIEKVYILFVNKWLNGFGSRLTRAKHSVLKFNFNSKQLQIESYGENGNFSHLATPFEANPQAKNNSTIKQMFLSKDVLPAIEGIYKTEVIGKIKVSVSNSMLMFSYKTGLAEFAICIPTCNIKGKRNSTSFVSYGEKNGN